VDPAVRDGWLERAHASLVAAGLRLGAARTGVVEVLARDGQCLIEAREIIDRLRERGGPGSAASVYRVLDELRGLGLVRRDADPDGGGRYEIVFAAAHHHHFVDVESGSIESFIDEGLEAAIQEAGRRLGVRLTGHSVELRGTRTRPQSAQERP
jgi:Fur family ferric uptake transcriptional regulator